MVVGTCPRCHVKIEEHEIHSCMNGPSFVPVAFEILAELRRIRAATEKMAGISEVTATKPQPENPEQHTKAAKREKR